jgi:hypothetical protein
MKRSTRRTQENHRKPAECIRVLVAVTWPYPARFPLWFTPSLFIQTCQKLRMNTSQHNVGGFKKKNTLFGRFLDDISDAVWTIYWTHFERARDAFWTIILDAFWTCCGTLLDAFWLFLLLKYRDKQLLY